MSNTNRYIDFPLRCQIDRQLLEQLHHQLIYQLCRPRLTQLRGRMFIQQAIHLRTQLSVQLYREAGNRWVE